MRAALLACCVVAAGPAPGCGADPEKPGVLEIGLNPGYGGVFVPLEDGDAVPFVFVSNGPSYFMICLRALGVDPHGPDESVEVSVLDRLVAASLPGLPVEMAPDGAGFVLWDLRTVLQVEPCCINCSEAEVRGRIVDASGREFVGKVLVRLERGGCPDPTMCCQYAELCPDPAMANVCD